MCCTSQELHSAHSFLTQVKVLLRLWSVEGRVIDERDEEVADPDKGSGHRRPNAREKTFEVGEPSVVIKVQQDGREIYVWGGEA
jgi:hypothetical protein